MSTNPPDNPPTTEHRDYPLMSQHSDPEEYRGVWEEVLDDGGPTDNDGLIVQVDEDVNGILERIEGIGNTSNATIISNDTDGDGTRSSLGLEFDGSVFIQGLFDHDSVDASRAIGFSGGRSSPPGAWINAQNGVAHFEGGERAATRPWVDDTRFTNSDARSAISGTDPTLGGITYDPGLDGSPFHIQRAADTDETAISLRGTNVGIDQVTSPSVSLDVGGVIHSGGDHVPTVTKSGDTVTFDIGDGEELQFVRE